MKILWVKADFLHPTTRGGRIRTLEMLRRLHRNHEIHYVAYEEEGHPEGPGTAREYSTCAYPVHHSIPRHSTPAFFAQAAAGLFWRLPVAVQRYASEAMRATIRKLTAQNHFDHLVCDFPHVAVNIDDLPRWVLFQHNVESIIWRRHADAAGNAAARAYFGLQARRMFDFERHVCRTVLHNIAVSDTDAAIIRREFGVGNVSAIPTGVDVEQFTPPEKTASSYDLIFVGAMDWLPNIDGIRHFVRSVLPLIRRSRPDCSLAIVGRTPAAEIRALANADPHITVTGTVPDVREYLWRARASIVPLRIGGGTRLKIYESMAARVPVVSTGIGAEGLPLRHSEHILLADTPEEFAAQCLHVLEDAAGSARLADAAWNLVSSQFSWDRAAEKFEEILGHVR